MIEGLYTPNETERPPTQHNVSKRANNVALGLDVWNGMLLNSIEQLSIAEIRN